MTLIDRDIPQTTPQRLTRLVTRFNGFWFFQIPESVVKPFTRGNVKYYKMPVEFATVRENSNNPNAIQHRGKPGDYLLKHTDQNLTILPANQYDILVSTKKLS